MIWVADSGSTTTTWAEVETGNKVVTEGLNPLFSDDELILAACRKVRKSINENITADSNINPDITLYFYGAGWGNKPQRNRMTQMLQKGFETDRVVVDTDLLGACRAVCGNTASLVGILGTGSNACYFDGNTIKYKAISLGYVLGDEGSANHMGRYLLKEYLSGRMPDDIKTLFHETYPYSYDEWIDHIYNKPNANRFLASLARFATDHIDLMERENNIWWIVDQWHSEQLGGLIYQSHCDRINIVGGFAKAIESSLRETLTSYGLHVGTIVADPIDGLVKYHSSF